MGKGTYTELDIKSVRSTADKTINFLKNKLTSLANHEVTVIFLGEMHKNKIDEEVTGRILANVPVRIDDATCVVFERGLKDTYAPWMVQTGLTKIEETSPFDTPIKARDINIAEQILDAVNNANQRVLYVPCGSEHSKGVFTALDKRMTKNFGYVVKPSVTD